MNPSPQKLGFTLMVVTSTLFSKASIEKEGLQDMIIEHGRLEKDLASGKSGRQQVLDAMRCSDLLVLVHGENPDS